MRRLTEFEALVGGVRPVLALPGLVEKLEEKIPHANLQGLLRTMELYSDEKQLPPTLFANEQRENVGHGKSYMIWAFKNKHFRIYGARESIEGHDCFICSELDDNKKRRKADPKKLSSAAKKLHVFMRG